MSPRGTALNLVPAGVKSVPVGVLANLPGNTMGDKLLKLRVVPYTKD